MGLTFGLVMMCLSGPAPAGVDQCKLFYVRSYNTYEECAAGIEADIEVLEKNLARAKAEDTVCATMNRKAQL